MVLRKIFELFNDYRMGMYCCNSDLLANLGNDYVHAKYDVAGQPVVNSTYLVMPLLYKSIFNKL